MHVINHNWSLVSYETASSFAACSQDKPSFIQFCQGTGFDNVGHGLGLTTRTQISVCKLSFPSAGIAVSLFRAKERCSRDNCCRGRSKPGGRIVGSHTDTRWKLTTWADFQLCLHRLLMSAGCKSSHICNCLLLNWKFFVFNSVAVAKCVLNVLCSLVEVLLCDITVTNYGSWHTYEKNKNWRRLWPILK